MKKFKIKTRKSKQYFDVYIYDKRIELEKDAFDYDKQAGKKYMNHKGVIGVCHPFERFQIKGKKEIHHPQVGIIRLYKNVGIGVASHEVLHGAFWMYRLKHKLANFEDQCSKKEEELGHIFTELVMDLTRKMYKYEIWV